MAGVGMCTASEMNILKCQTVSKLEVYPGVQVSGIKVHMVNFLALDGRMRNMLRRCAEVTTMEVPEDSWGTDKG